MRALAASQMSAKYCTTLPKICGTVWYGAVRCSVTQSTTVHAEH